MPEHVPAYVIVQGEVNDPTKFEQYRASAPATVAAAGGEYLVRGGPTQPLEGAAPPPRTTVLRFHSREAALDWYHSEGYRLARAAREGAATFNMYVVDGI